MPEPTTDRRAEVLTGRLAEYDELREQLWQRPGLLVVSSDPWSGTSALLGAATAELDGSVVMVDARSCGDANDLATAIADTAVSTLAPTAAAWWRGAAPASGRAGLRLLRELASHGIDPATLREEDAPDLDRLTAAVELALLLATERQLTLVVDHLGMLLSTSSISEARDLLGSLRALRQRHPELDLVLVEHRGGIVGTALADEGHALYRAGQRMQIRRPDPMRFHQDMSVARGWTTMPTSLLVASAELAEGVPALTWQIAENAPRKSLDWVGSAAAGWGDVRRATTLTTARHWDALRRVHPLAQAVTAALASGLGPHAVQANSKSVNDALRRLRDLGMAWQPAVRTWAGSDPLLAAWVRDHPPAWVTRRRAAIR